MLQWRAWCKRFQAFLLLCIFLLMHCFLNLIFVAFSCSSESDCGVDHGDCGVDHRDEDLNSKDNLQSHDNLQCKKQASRYALAWPARKIGRELHGPNRPMKRNTSKHWKKVAYLAMTCGFFLTLPKRKRKKRKRLKKKQKDSKCVKYKSSEAQNAERIREEENHDKIPSFRGGAMGSQRQRQVVTQKQEDTLLRGLQKLLSNVGAQKVTEKPKEQNSPDLLTALRDLVDKAQNDTVDLLSELQNLVAQETHKRQRHNGPKQSGQNRWKSMTTNTMPTQQAKRWQKGLGKQEWRIEEDWQVAGWRPRKADWTQPGLKQIWGARELADELDKKQDQPILCMAYTEAEFVEAVQVAQSEKQLNLTVIFATDKKEINLNELSEDIAEKAQRKKLPGFEPGKGVRMRWAWVLGLGQEFPELKGKQTVELKTKKAEIPENTWVLRLIAPKPYQENWHQLLANPGAQARQWACSQPNAQAKAMMDTWAFECVDRWLVKGYMRIKDQNVAMALLQGSGSKQHETRWFVEPVVREHFPTLPGHVLWHQWDEKENYDQYAQRIRSTSKEGLVAGRYQLGTRTTKDDPRRVPTSSLWRLDGMPKEYTIDCVEELLEQVGFLDINVETKERHWRGSAWTFRARRDDDQEVLQPVFPGGKDGEAVEVVLTKQVRRRAPEKIKSKLASERQVYFDIARMHHNYKHDNPRTTHWKEENIKEDTEVAATALDASQEEEAKDDEPMEDTETRKRKAGDKTTPASKAKVQPTVRQPWLPKNAKRVENEGRGDCLYHAIAQSLNKIEVGSSSRSHRQIRAFGVAYMRRQSADYEALWDKKDSKGNEFKGSFQQYLDNMQKCGTWAGYLEVFALANALRRKIQILHYEKGNVWTFNEDYTKKPINLLFLETVGHYEFLDGPIDEELQSRESTIVAAEQIKNCNVRGGGSLRLTDFASSVRSDKQSLRLTDFKSQHAVSHRVKTPIGKSSCRSVVSRTHVVTTAGASPRHDGGNEEPFGVSECEIWTCNLCGYDVRAKTPDLCSKYRHKHIRKVHPGVALDQFHKRSAAATLVEPAQRCVEDAVWQCAKCKLTLPVMDKRLLARSAKAHLKKCMPKTKVTLRQNQKKLRKGHTVHKVRFQKLTKAARLAKLRHLEESINEASKATGHKLEKIMFPALTWKSDITLTCQTCTRFFRCIKEARGSKQCPGVDGAHGRSRKWLRKGNWWTLARMSHTAELHLVLQVWKPTVFEVLQLEKMMKPSHAKKCPPLTSNIWIRSLLEDGDIEANPGPQSCLKAVSINTGGSHMAMAAFDQYAMENYDVIAIQELCMTHSKQHSFRCMAHRRGYACFLSCHQDSYAGGVALLVRVCHRTTLIHKKVCASGYHVVAEVGDILLGTVYRSPSSASTDFIVDTLEFLESIPRGRQWCLIGDWNLQPQDALVVDNLCNNGNVVVAVKRHGDFEPSRWQGARAIDWVLTNDGYLVKTGFLLDKWSDHKALEVQLQCRSPTVVCNEDQPTQPLLPPKDIPADVWQKAFDTAWERVSVPLTGNTDDEWANFCFQAERAFQVAMHECQVRRSGGAWRAKGSCPHPQPGRIGRTQASGSRSFAHRKLRRDLGRLLEIQRRPEHSWLPGEKEALVNKVYTRQCFPRSMAVVQAIDAMEVRVQDLLAHETTLAIQKWRNKMQSMGTATRTYVRHAAGYPGFQLKSTTNGVHAQSGSPSEALNMLEEHWSQIWRRDTPDLTEAWNYWQNHASSTPMVPLPWKPLLPCELYTQAQARTGKAAGCDGWSGSEVAALPFRAWEVFAELVNKWFERKSFPTVWRHLRQTHIPKETGFCEAPQVSKMRPIAIESIFWRIASAAWFKRMETADWVANWAPREAHGGIGRKSVYGALRAMDHGFAQGSILISLDFAQAFDRVIPSLALQCLQALGMPKEMVQACSHIWCHQLRWLQLRRFVAPSPVSVDMSLPQGDSLSPVALVALLVAPTLALRRQVPQATMATYMDDRNILVKSAQKASEVVVFWREAASVLGLKENEEKLKVVPRSVAQRRDLADVGLQASIFDTARVLGVDFTSKLTAGMPQRPTAVRRLKEAESRARRVACLPVGFEQRHTLLRQMVFPLAAWGHFLKQLPVGATTALRALSRKALYCTAAQGHAGRRDVLEGHYVNVVALSQMQAVLALGWTVRKGEISTYAGGLVVGWRPLQPPCGTGAGRRQNHGSGIMNI